MGIMVHRCAANAFVVGLAFVPAVASAAPNVALYDLASQCGYRYSFIGAEQAVALTRHGLALKVRPGAELYEFNDREIPVDGAQPYYADGDIFVSPSLAARFRRYASCDPSRRVAETTTTGGTALGGALNAATGTLNVEGPTAIDTISAKQIPEQSQIAVNGSATPNARVALTLYAIPAHDLPEVVVSRTRLRADEKGQFSAVISTASLFYPGSLVRLTADTESGSSKTVPITLVPPNHDKDVPSDRLEPGMR